jgi:two-component system response regulator AtoC
VTSDATGQLLVVDDDPDTLLLTRLVLEDAFPNVSVHTADSAIDGLSIVEAFGPDVVLSDYQMHRMHGLSFLAKVQELVPHARRLLMTALPDASLRRAAQEAGVGFIYKAVSPDELLEAVRDALPARGVPLPAHPASRPRPQESP